MIADGQHILAALAELDGVQHTGWASQAAQAEDIALLCPGAWLQPGAADQASEAGHGRHTKFTRTWLVVLTVSGEGEDALEPALDGLLQSARARLAGRAIGDHRPPRRLQYVREGEPFYAPGYIELPIELELNETFSGETT